MKQAWLGTDIKYHRAFCTGRFKRALYVIEQGASWADCEECKECLLYLYPSRHSPFPELPSCPLSFKGKSHECVYFGVKMSYTKSSIFKLCDERTVFGDQNYHHHHHHHYFSPKCCDLQQVTYHLEPLFLACNMWVRITSFPYIGLHTRSSNLMGC